MVSTWEQSIKRMQRASVGLFKKPVKTLNAKTLVKGSKVTPLFGSVSDEEIEMVELRAAA